MLDRTKFDLRIYQRTIVSAGMFDFPEKSFSEKILISRLYQCREANHMSMHVFCILSQTYWLDTLNQWPRHNYVTKGPLI